jgi:phosphoglycerol transferase MdoB-like AlkP superfamily enzyme
MKKTFAGVFAGVVLALPMTIAQSQAQSPSAPPTTQVISLPKSSGLASPLELQQFAQAIKQLRSVEMETQKKMAEALKEEGLSPQRFQEIGQRQDNPDSPLTADISPKDQQRFDKALAKINQIQQDAVPKQNRAVRLQGLTLERFNQIGRAIDQNPALKRQMQGNL